MSSSHHQSGPVIQPEPQSSVWEEARDRYRKTLNPTQQKKFEEAFTNAASLTDVITAVESAGQSASHKFSTRFRNALEPLQTLAPVFDVVANINTTIGCSIWGPLKLVVQASSKYSDGLETILNVIETLTTNVRRYKIIEEMHDSSFIRDVLRNFYFDLIDFCARCVKYFSRPKIINGLRAAFKSFDVEAKDIISKMNRHASAVDSTATTMEMEKANLFRKQQIQKNLEDQERTIRLWLKSASFEDEQKLRQKERVKGTNDWFLQHPSFKNWTNPSLPADNPHLLWAYGKPGCGKSILASSVVLELHSLGFRPIYFFFNSESGTASSDPIGLVRAFFFQLLDIDPELVNHLFPIYTKSSSGEASSFDTLWEVFHSWCSRRSEPVFFVVDALDEALDGCKHPDNFLAAIVGTLKSCGMVRICVTSRPNPRIAKHFSPNTDLNLDVDSYSADQGNRTPSNDGITTSRDGSFISQVTISERQVSSDIMVYVTTKVRSSSKLQSWMAPPDIHALCVRAEGMFLWARLMIDELQNTTTPNSLREMLNKAPKGLNAIYRLITQRLVKTLSDDQLHLCRKVLQWTTTAREPLTINQLAIASAIREGDNRLDEKDIPFREDVLTVCAPLVEILEDDTVRIVHLSVKEFLLESPTEGQGDFAFSENSVNANLGVALLTLLSFDEFCPTGPPRTLDDRADDENDSPKARQMLQYSLHNWYLHCIDSGIVKEAHQLFQLALDYLTSDKSFLWMEHLAYYERTVNWIHIENQLLEWVTNFDAESSSSFRGVVHRLADRRLAYLKRNFGETHTDTLHAIVDLARTYWNQGRWVEAEALGVEALEALKKVFGETHPNTLGAMANLAVTYLSQGRWAEAEALGVEVLESRKKGLGETHPDTLNATTNLAIAYGNQGRWAEAEALRVEVLEGLREGLGETHPNTINAMANLSITYGNQGRWAESEALGLEVLESRKKGLGKTHPDTLNAMANLATTYRNQGRWVEAEALEVDVLEDRKKGLGKTHPSTLNAMANLAKTYGNQGRWAKAEALGVEVLEGRKKGLGETHPDTLNAMAYLAITYGNQGRWAEAEALGVEVLRDLKRELGETHHDTLSAMTSLATIYGSRGQWVEAEALEVEVLEGFKKGFGEAHPDTLNAMANLSITYGNQGRRAESEALGVEALEGLKKGLGDTHPDTLNAMANLATTYRNQGRWVEAEALEVEVLEGHKKGLGETHPSTLNAMANLAVTNWSQGRWAEAEALGVEVLEGLKKGFGETHPDIPKAKANLAVIYGNQGRRAEAEALYVEVLQSSSKKGSGETT